MDKLKVKLKHLVQNSQTPVYSTPDSAACDLFASLEPAFAETGVTIAPGEIRLIPTGIAIECQNPPDLAVLIFARSGLSTKFGISLANGVGVVDLDYRGEIKVPLINNSQKPYTVHSGDRIAQMMFVPILRADFVESNSLDETERGTGGFGSTGIN